MVSRGGKMLYNIEKCDQGIWKMKGIFSLRGTVLHGKHLGSELGFPTVNLPLPAQGAPQNGVYAAKMTLTDTGEKLVGVLNQGVHPTFPSGAPSVEMHILDKKIDLYGREIEITYEKFLRPEMQFADGGALVAQIRRDIAATREYFGI